jgi:hypothetical protein
MRRPIIGINARVDTTLEVTPKKQALVRLEGVELEKRLRKKRSKTFVEAMSKLDVSGVVAQKEKVQELIDQIVNEFPELIYDQLPIGIVSKCYLGEPYEVHTLSRSLQIIEHFKKGERLPNGLERARRLALHPSYAYIEVYSNMMCAVSQSGDVSIVKE